MSYIRDGRYGVSGGGNPFIECDNCKVRYALKDGDIAGQFVPKGWQVTTYALWLEGGRSFCSMTCAVDYATRERDEFVQNLHHGTGVLRWPEKATQYAKPTDRRKRGLVTEAALAAAAPTP